MGFVGSNIDSGIRLSPRMIYRLVMKLTKRASRGLVRFSYVAGQPFASLNMERSCMYFGNFVANASFNVVVVMVHCFLSFPGSSGKLMSHFCVDTIIIAAIMTIIAPIIVGRHSVLSVARMKSKIIQSIHPIGIIFKFKVRLTSVLIITNIVVRAVLLHITRPVFLFRLYSFLANWNRYRICIS